jgi:hypothetical protein
MGLLEHETYGVDNPKGLWSNPHMVTYALPDGTRFQADYDLCHGAHFISFTTKEGRVIYVPRVSTQDKVFAAYLEWKNR